MHEGRPRVREQKVTKPQVPAPAAPAAPEVQNDQVEQASDRGPGRPSAFENIDLSLAYRFAKAGLVDEQIAELLGISIRTYYDYKTAHPEFSQALKEGQEDPKARVKRALYQRAIGYTHEEEKIFCHEGKIVRASTMKHYPPDPKCIEFYLINKVGEEFKNISHVNASGSVNLNHKGTIASAFAEDMNRLLQKIGERPVSLPGMKDPGQAAAPAPRAAAATPSKTKPAPAPEETSADLGPEDDDARAADDDALTFTPADYAVEKSSIPLDLSDLEEP